MVMVMVMVVVLVLVGGVTRRRGRGRDFNGPPFLRVGHGRWVPFSECVHCSGVLFIFITTQLVHVPPCGEHERLVRSCTRAPGPRRLAEFHRHSPQRLVTFCRRQSPYLLVI